MSEHLTLVCRAAEVVHATPLDPSTGEQVGSASYQAFRFRSTVPVQLARGDESRGDYSIGGDWSQCGATATFLGATLTAAVDEAVRMGWDVDVPTLGFYGRADLCPACNPNRGRRPTVQSTDNPAHDTYSKHLAA